VINDRNVGEALSYLRELTIINTSPNMNNQDKVKSAALESTTKTIKALDEYFLSK
jgi:hypothetical protein